MVLDFGQLVATYNSGATAVTATPNIALTAPTWYSIPVGHPDDGKLHAGCDLFVTVTYPGGTTIVPGTVTDTKGHVYSLVGQANAATTPLGWVAVFHAKLTAQLVVGTDTIKYTHSAAAGSRTTTVSAVAFRGAQAAKADVVVNVQTRTGTGTAVTTANQPLLRNPATNEVEGVPQTLLCVLIGSDAISYSPGTDGSELFDFGANTTRRQAVELMQQGPGSADPYVVAGTLSGSTNWAAISFSVRPAYAPATIYTDAGRDRVVKPGRPQLLDGRRTSHNANGTPNPATGPLNLTYSWQQIGGPSVGTITPAIGGRVAAYIPPAVPAGTELTFELTATHTSGGVDTDTVTHTIGPVAPTVELQLGDQPPVVVELGGEGEASLDDELLYLDGLSIAWRYSNPDQVVRQIEPMVGKVQLSTPDVANLWGIESGLPGYVRVFDEYGDHVASVHGRLSELTATQALYRRKGQPKQLRTQLQLDVVDHLGTEGEVIEELVTPNQRFGSYWYDVAQTSELEVDFPQSWTDPDYRVSVVGRARAMTTQNVGLVDQLRACLFEAPLSTTPTSSTDDAIYLAHYLLLPVVQTGPGAAYEGALDHFSLHVVPGAESPIGHNYFPARNLVEPPAGHPHVIPASKVELSGTYRQQANRRPNAVTVKLRNNPDTADTVTSVKASPGRRNRVTRQLDAAIACLITPGWTSATYGAPIARMHLPEQDVDNLGWERDGFVYRPDTFEALTGGRNGDWYDADGYLFGRLNAYGPPGGCWFPDMRTWREAPTETSSPDYFREASFGGWDRYSMNVRAFELAPECFLRPVVVEGIPAHGSLARWDGRYTGHLSAATLTIVKGKPVVSFELTQTEPEPSLPGPTIDPEVRI